MRKFHAGPDGYEFNKLKCSYLRNKLVKLAQPELKPALLSGADLALPRRR